MSKFDLGTRKKEYIYCKGFIWFPVTRTRAVSAQDVRSVIKLKYSLNSLNYVVTVERVTRRRAPSGYDYGSSIYYAIC